MQLNGHHLNCYQYHHLFLLLLWKQSLHLPNLYCQSLVYTVLLPLQKLLAVTVHVVHFTDNLRIPLDQRWKGPIWAEEYAIARLRWIKDTPLSVYNKEIESTTFDKTTQNTMIDACPMPKAFYVAVVKFIMLQAT